MNVTFAKRWAGLLIAMGLWLSSSALPLHASDTARLLYESRRTGDSELYTRFADGTGEVNLTNTPAADEHEYLWSPNGTKIAYTSSSPSGLPDAFVMDADGGNVVQLTASETRRETGLTWSPDSTKLAFASLSDDGTSGLIYVFDTVRLTVTNVATFDEVVDSSPSWSPDSSRLTFVRSTLNEAHLITRSDVFVVMANASNQVQLTGTDGILDTAPVWSPAGSQIAFLRGTVDAGTGDRGPADLHVMNTDGTNVRNLSNDGDDDGFFSWSPNGTRIAFSRSIPGSSTLYVVDVAGGGLTQIDTATDPAAAPKWSPDGTKLAYFRVLTGEGHDAANVYIAAADGSDTQIVGSDIEVNTDPDWSPDGSRIAFASRRNGTGSIDVVDADGTGRVDLTNFPTFYGAPKWQPPVPPLTDMAVLGFASPRFVASGSQVSYEVDVHNFGPNPAGTVTLIVQLSGVTLTSVTDNAGGTCAAVPGASLECDFPAMAAGDVRVVTFLATATGGPYTPLQASFHVASSTPDSDSSNNSRLALSYIAASPLPAPTPNPADSGVLAFNASNGHDDDVFVQRADGTGLTDLTNHPDEEDSYTWSPDGSKLAFLRYDADTLTVSLGVMNADGSNLRLLTNVAGEYIYALAWSPDGGKIAFSTSAWVAGPTSGEVSVINADGTGRFSLSGSDGLNGAPAWSPDGSRISYVRTHLHPDSPPTSDLFIAHADGTSQIQVAHPDGASDAGAEWSPEGTRLAFMRALPDNTNDLYTVRADGSDLLRLTNDSSLHSLSPHWSPNGTRLSFADLNPNGGPALEVINADGTGRLGLYTPPDDGWGYTAGVETWSPDGAKLAFQYSAMRLGSDGGQRGNVCIANTNGTGMLCIGNDLDRNQNPAWSPDGQRIAFNTLRNGVNGLDVVNADTTGRVELPGALAGYGPPKWRPVAAAPPPAPTTCYALNQLRLGGFAAQSVFAFSRTGKVLGQTSKGAFLYDGTMHDLNALLGPGSTVGFSLPSKSLSEEGSVLGTGTDPSAPDTQFAVLFDASGAHRLSLGGTFSLPLDINAAGQAIGIATTAAGEQHAFRYDHGTMTDLGTLGGTQSYPYAISGNGRIAGVATTAGGEGHAFLYDETGMHDLGVLPGGTWSSATAVSDTGQVAGTAEVAGGSYHAFLYDGLLMRDLGVLPGGTHSEAMFVNAAGQVAGLANAPDVAAHAFFFDGSALVDLTPDAQTAEVLRLSDSGVVDAKSYATFNSDGGPLVVYDASGLHDVSLGGSATFSRGLFFSSFGVLLSVTNASGAVAGSSYTPGDAERHAILYDGTGLHDLTATAGGFGDARGINGPGSVVGVANGSPFLYQGGVLSNLNDFTCGAGVVLADVYGISDDGTILASGSGGYYLLTSTSTPVPPPPSYPPQPPSPTTFPGPPAVASGRILFESTRDGNSEIYVMNADGTGQTNLTQNPGNDHDPVWSPDGSTIAFLRGSSSLFLMNADGSDPRQLTASFSRPAWSPDGLKMAFSNSGGISVIHVDGTQGATLTSTLSDQPDGSLVWSPDGTKIAFVSNRDGNAEIYVMNADGTGQTNLTHFLGSDYSPAWSPDGTKIVFVHEYQIYVMNADGSNRINVSHSAPDPNYNPVWSPDGRVAYYRIVQNSPSAEEAGVFVVNADGSGAEQVSVYTSYDTTPDWSPDGQHLALTSFRDGNSEIYLINSDGTGPLNLTHQPSYDVKPRWQPTPAPNTPVGSNVTVSLNGVTVTFPSVTVTGYTSVTPANPNSLTGVPGEYLINADSLAFEIHTTATFTGPVTLGFHVPGINNSVLFSALRVLHSEPPPVPNFVDRTIFPPDTPSQNFATRMVYARAASLGLFLVTRYKDTVDPVTTASLSPSPNAAGWNRTDVTVTLTASDGPYGSGVQSLTYWTTGAQVIAQTTVTGNTASIPITTDGTTTVHFKATDVAVNVEAAKSVAVKIDRTAPVAHLTAPDAKTYTLNQSVPANYHCTDTGGSGVASCAGPVADGAPFDTASVGVKSFAVNALDAADNAAGASVSYTVTYGVQALYDQTQATKSGLPVAIKLQIVDVAGINQSSAAVVVTAVGVTRKSDGTSVPLPGAGTAFTFDSTLAGYVFNVNSTGYAAGVYLLSFSAAGDPVAHTVQFKIK